MQVALSLGACIYFLNEKMNSVRRASITGWANKSFKRFNILFFFFFSCQIIIYPFFQFLLIHFLFLTLQICSSCARVGWWFSPGSYNPIIFITPNVDTGTSNITGSICIFVPSLYFPQVELQLRYFLSDMNYFYCQRKYMVILFSIINIIVLGHHGCTFLLMYLPYQSKWRKFHCQFSLLLCLS